MDFSRIYLNSEDFYRSEKNFYIEKNNEKKENNKYFNKNQKSFHFEDYFETYQNKQKVKNSNISQDRIYLLFFIPFINFDICIKNFLFIIKKT